MSINPIRFARTSTGATLLATITAFAALGMSTVLSGSGVFFSLEVFSLNAALRVIMAAAVTFLITASIYLAMRRAGFAAASRKFEGILHNRRSGFVVLSIIFGLFMVTVSSTTSFSAMAFLRYEAAIQTSIDARANVAITDPLRAMATNYGVVAAEAGDVSVLAAYQSNIESASGGTCGPSEVGEGPIARLRASHAASLAVMNTAALTLAKDAQSLLGELSGGLSQSQIDDVHRRAQTLSLSPERARIDRLAVGMREGYAGSGFLWEGVRRSCDDPVMVAALDRLLAAAGAGVELDASAPTKIEATLFDAYAVFWDLLSSARVGTTDASTMTSLPFFMTIAFFLDAIGALAAWRTGVASGRTLTIHERDELHKHRWVLQNFVWKFPVRKSADNDGEEPVMELAFLIVPHGGDGTKADDAEKFAFAFGLHVDAARQYIPMDALPKAFAPFTDRLRLSSGGATSITVYPIEDQKTYDQIERHKRLCALALWSDRSQSSVYGDVNDKNWSAGLQSGHASPQPNLHSIFG